jgi:hypothetical protein
LKDTFIIIGFLSIVAGCGWHYGPLAAIVGGSLMLGGGLASHFYRGGK